ncbi:MAG: ABC transporter permease [Chloroflexi bacterium]|nr:ABC transporter permease [Chloroflexota bacterium]
MRRYAAARLAALVPTLLAVSLLAFALAELAGGDPAREAAEQGGQLAESGLVAELRARWGLDNPLPVRYARWLADAVRGDLGESYLSRRPVARELLEAFPATLLLALAALAVAAGAGIPLGVWAALRRDSLLDHLSRVVAVSFTAVPGFWLGLLLIALFAEALGWLPAGGFGLDTHLALPALTLGAASAATVMRLVRANVLDVIALEFVRAAHARGLAPGQVAWRHILPNALVPAVSHLGLRFGDLLAGAVVVESIFAWPGVGRVVLTAVSGRDLPVIAGFVLLSSCVFVTVNLVADLLCAALDPRIRLP